MCFSMTRQIFTATDNSIDTIVIIGQMKIRTSTDLYIINIDGVSWYGVEL